MNNYRVVNFKGDKFALKVIGKSDHYAWLAGNSQGDYDASKAWWEGVGILKTEDKEFTFLFKTREHRDSGPGDLQKEFILITGISDKSIVPDMTEIIDVFCEELSALIIVEEAKENRDEIVSIEKLPIIDGEPLIEKGIIIEPGHQLEIPVKV